jgi:hypothetical protein
MAKYASFVFKANDVYCTDSAPRQESRSNDGAGVFACHGTSSPRSDHGTKAAPSVNGSWAPARTQHRAVAHSNTLLQERAATIASAISFIG